MKEETKGIVSDIKRFAVHDGDGIRTTVFFKGCPLKCIWCHNPESIDSRPRLAYYPHKCLGCGECAAVCPSGAQMVTEKGHEFRRGACLACGRCEEVCPGGALKFYGRAVTVEELLPRLLEDRDFYETSGGGVTLSGGECLSQAPFCAELLRALKENGIRTAVDTCGYAPKEAFDLVLPYTDVFLYDIKAIDEEVHRRCTGRGNRRILENLRRLDRSGKGIEIRFPFVPGFNDGETERIREFLKTLNRRYRVRVLPYHNFAGSKYAALDLENTLPQTLPEESAVRAAEERLNSI